MNLSGNHIGDEGVRALSTLLNLTSLTLSFNSIGDEGAQALSTLTNLTSLSLDHNSIGAEEARALSTLTNLASLDLIDNRIGDEGARALATLTNLTSLNLFGNNIGVEGARALSTLTNLTSLNLDHNSIGDEGARALLEAWALLPDLHVKNIRIRQNGDLSSLLPAEVLNCYNAEQIITAYCRFRDAKENDELRPLNEAKLLVLGKEAVGKTSLIRYLVDNQPRNPSEPKTPGTSIRERIETQDWSINGSPVILHVWDFGGQEILHGTHRFFLTERSLYLLVLEARREDDRSVYEWLNTIRNRGGESPVIVVTNKCDLKDHCLSLDERELKDKHPNIVAFARTSCDSGEDAAATIAALRELIVNTLSNNPMLKHVRDSIPNSWLRVKSTIAELARQRSVMESRTFIQICEGTAADHFTPSEVVADPTEQQVLLQLLHDLGAIVAHGLTRNSPAVLREVTLLDPNWLTAAIYTLLTHSKIRDDQGEFQRGQLMEFLDPKVYPEQWHEFILNMMQSRDVGLAFQLPGTDGERYLIPEALPKHQPNYDVWPGDSLLFRFEYSYLPPGLIPCFIVAANRKLTTPPTRWKNGAVLAVVGCRILVRADHEFSRVDIAVAGPVEHRRTALNIILDDLQEAHSRLMEFPPKAVVPLQENSDVSVGYAHLERLEQMNGPSYGFLPEGAERTYTVSELLNGVRREPEMARTDRRFRDELLLANPQIVVRDPRSVTNEMISDKQDGNTWVKYAVTCGVSAAILWSLFWMIPVEWRFFYGSTVTVFLVATALVLAVNPTHFYRRSFASLLSGGVIANIAGISLSAWSKDSGIELDSSTSGLYWIAWAVVCVAVIWADRSQMARK